jgi:hypothetical protein
MRPQRLVPPLVQVHLPVIYLLNLDDKFIENDLSVDVENLLEKRSATPWKLPSLDCRADGFVVLPVSFLAFRRAVVRVSDLDDVDSTGWRIFASCTKVPVKSFARLVVSSYPTPVTAYRKVPVGIHPIHWIHIVQCLNSCKYRGRGVGRASDSRINPS